MATFKGKVLNCKECGKEFKVPQSRKEAKYCSKECADGHRSDKRKVKKVEKACERCGKLFYDHPCYSERRKYCSYECANQSYVKTEKRICAYCERIFEVNPSSANICCSMECRTARSKTGDWPLSKKLLRQCEQCGKEFWKKLSDVKKGGGKFCSTECKSESQTIGNKIPSSFYSLAIWEKTRTRIIGRDKVCKKCGFSGKGLHVHHLKYKRHGGTEDDSNLIALCAHCHRVTHCEEISFSD